MTRNRRHPAFTLLELVLVMAILTIVVGAVAPSLRGFTLGRTGKNTASRILSMTHYARTAAVGEGRIYRLNYATQNRTLWLTAEEGAAHVQPGNDLAESLQIDERLSITFEGLQTGTAGEQYLEFLPSGRTNPASIVISDDAGGEIEIACQSATEMFRILKPEERTR